MPDYDVAIVGYGPVGAALANLLGMSGLKVAVQGRPNPLPRARPGELFREMGGQEGQGGAQRRNWLHHRFLAGAGRQRGLRRGAS